MMFQRVLWTLCTVTVAVSGLDWALTERESRLAVSGTAYPTVPEVATLSDGRVVAGWFDSDSETLHAMILTDGDPVVRGSTIVVHRSNNIVFGIESKELAGIDGGGFVITWIESNELYYREYSSAGVAVTAAPIRASNFLMGGHGATKHSVIGHGTGGAVMFFADGVGNSFYKTGDTYATEVAPLHGMAGELVMDIVEMQVGIVVFFADTADFKFAIYDSSSFMLVTAPTLLIASLSFSRVEVGSTKYARDVPLITVAAHDAANSYYRTWKFDDDPTSIAPSTFSEPTAGAAHVSLAVGDSSTHGGQIVLFDYNGEFVYRTSDGYDDISSGFTCQATTFPVTSFSVAQLAANGWIAIFNEQKLTPALEFEDGVSISYYRAPEKQFTMSWRMGVGPFKAMVIPTGGYCVTGLSGTFGQVAVMDDDHNLVATQPVGQGSQNPTIAGCIGTTSTCIFTVFDSIDVRRVKMDMITGSSNFASVTTSQDHRAKVCGIDDLVILGRESPGNTLITGYFGIDSPTSRQILGVTNHSPFDFEFSCRESDYLLVYIGSDGSLQSMAFDASTSQGVTNHGGPSITSIESVFTFSDGSTVVFVLSSSALFSYSFERDEWVELTHNLGLNVEQMYLVSKPLEEDALHVSFLASNPTVKDDSGYAIGYLKFDKFGTDIQNVEIINNFVIGHQLGLVIETYTGPVLIYSSFTGDGVLPAWFILPLDVASSFTKTDEVPTNKIAGIQTSPKSCGLGDGSAVVVWSSSSGAHSSVHAQMYGPSGAAKFNEEFMVNSGTTLNHVLPSVACYDSGFFVVWEAQFASGSSVFVQQFDSDGVRVGSEILINTVSVGKEARAAIATTSTGDRYVVAWHGDLGLGDFTDVYVRFMNPASMVNPDPVMANTVVTSVQKDASIDMRDDYSTVVVWQSNFQDGSRYGVYSREYDTGHNPVAMAEELVPSTTLDSQANAQVKYFSDGRYIVAWTSRHTGAAHVYAAVFLSATKVVDDFRINANNDGNHWPSSICVFEDDSFIVGWNYYFSSSEQDAYLRRFGSDMLPRSGDKRVNTYTNRRQYDPTIAIFNTNNYLVSWVSRWQDATSWSVYSTMFVRNATLEAVSGIPDSTGTGGQAILRSMPDGSVVGVHMSCSANCPLYASYTSSVDGVTTMTQLPGVSVATAGSFDMQVVGENVMYLFAHDANLNTIHIYSIGITNGVFGAPDQIGNFDATGLITSAPLFPSMTVSGDDMALIWKDTSNALGDNLIMKVYNIPGDSAVSYTLFSSMTDFSSGHSLATLSNGLLALSTSMAFSGAAASRPYLSVVDHLTGVVKATVSLTSEESHYNTAVTVLDDDMVVVCYSVMVQFVPPSLLPIYCSVYQVTVIGIDTFITKVGNTVDTVLYAYGHHSEAEGFSLSTVSGNRFAIAGRDPFTDLVHVKVFTSDMVLDEAYTPQNNLNAQGLGISVAKYQDTGLAVTMWSTHSSSAMFRTMFWKQPSTIINNFDTTVPTTGYGDVRVD